MNESLTYRIDPVLGNHDLAGPSLTDSHGGWQHGRWSRRHATVRSRGQDVLALQLLFRRARLHQERELHRWV